MDFTLVSDIPPQELLPKVLFRSHSRDQRMTTAALDSKLTPSSARTPGKRLRYRAEGEKGIAC